MTHYPTPGAKARGGFDALRAEHEGFGTPLFLVDFEALREVLVAATCPAPCVGYVNETGWHTECEARADAAIAALGW